MTYGIRTFNGNSELIPIFSQLDLGSYFCKIHHNIIHPLRLGFSSGFLLIDFALEILKDFHCIAFWIHRDPS